jgi:hypothetical protein
MLKHVSPNHIVLQSGNWNRVFTTILSRAGRGAPRIIAQRTIKAGSRNLTFTCANLPGNLNTRPCFEEAKGDYDGFDNNWISTYQIGRAKSARHAVRQPPRIGDPALAVPPDIE